MDKTVRFWNVTTGECQQTLNAKSQVCQHPPTVKSYSDNVVIIIRYQVFNGLKKVKSSYHLTEDHGIS